MAAVRKLKTYITKITTMDGIILDSQLHSDMEGMMHHLNEEIKENNPDNFLAIILGSTDSSLKISR